MNQALLNTTSAKNMTPVSGVRSQTLIVLVRSIHGLIGLFFLFCIGSVYYAGITGQDSAWAYTAAAALVLEGIVVMLNHGNCPLGAVHHKVGDDKTFFELLLPKPLAKRAVPVLGMVAAAGMALMFLR